jgi:hypothetical protein
MSSTKWKKSIGCSLKLHAQKLERIKSEVKGGSDKKKPWTAGSSAEGIHEAILDIVKAMQGFAKSLSG